MPGKGPVRSRRNGSGLTRKNLLVKKNILFETLFEFDLSFHSQCLDMHNRVKEGTRSCTMFIGSCRRRHLDLNFGIFVDGGYAEQLTHRRPCCSDIDTMALHNPNSSLAAHGFQNMLALSTFRSYNITIRYLNCGAQRLRLVCLCVHQETPLRIRPLDAWR